MSQGEKQPYSDACMDAKKHAAAFGVPAGHSIFGERSSRSKARLRKAAEAKMLANMPEDVQALTQQAIESNEQRPTMRCVHGGNGPQVPLMEGTLYSCPCNQNLSQGL